ncbi:dual OB domain-containing protein [Pseudoalteromonas maricaloris]|uniref:dual OB domain-containing protein n=1 Tax=Pseudoalteromonas maricaloris TaxID=184924 RepID=UPI00029AB29F|nr:hypothetical protein [Pseudoalteromonas flavipulchra]
MNQTEIVVFANSIKHRQHCIAGKCVKTNKWIRPVSNENGAELSHEQAKYKNPYGIYEVKTLQKIKMGFLKSVPLKHQPENYLIDGKLWEQNFSISEAEVSNYLDEPLDLWGEGNRVMHALIVNGKLTISDSLYLVKVTGLQLYTNDDKKRRASFSYKGVAYDLAVTDPKFDDIVREKRKINDILCVSLGEEHKGYCYKLVAAIF